MVRAHAHGDDVNAVAYADDAGNLILSGSDDTLVKAWDRRMLGPGRRGGRPVLVGVGHTEGVTHIDPRGDGRHFISNGKDQTVRLWDLRAGMRSPSDADALPKGGVPSFRSVALCLY